MTTSLLALLDDIATLLDDVAHLTSAATKKTSAVLGDDLALNAEQVTGVHPDRELPVVWAVAKGSALNKVIVVPTALLFSAFLPWIITPILMLGGTFLCFEGFEKVVHHLHKQDPERRRERLRALQDPKVDLVALEKDKIKGAIRTDLILSAEIIVIALGTIQAAPFWSRTAALVAVAVIATVGVYLLVAGIVKLDDLGLRLKQRPGLSAKVGSGILWMAPRFLKLLSIAGTIAMFLVGGGILAHGIPWVHRFIHGAEVTASSLPHLGYFVGAAVPTVLVGAVGLIAGGLVTGIFTTVQRMRHSPASPD